MKNKKTADEQKFFYLLKRYIKASKEADTLAQKLRKLRQEQRKVREEFKASYSHLPGVKEEKDFCLSKYWIEDEDDIENYWEEWNTPSIR